MKLNQIIASVLTPAIAITSNVSMSAYAEQTFATPASFIRNVLEVACSDITSSSVSTAIESVVSQLAYSEGLISYSGTDLGYWYADDSAVLYADSSRSEVVIEETLTGYEADPEVISVLLTAVNNDISVTYAPTTDDWSKIVGKYDITLGDIMIPAEQWVTLETSDDPLADNKVINLSKLTDIDNNVIGGRGNSNNIYTFTWMVDNAGKLYIQNGLLSTYISAINWNYSIDTLQESGGEQTYKSSEFVGKNSAQYVKVGLKGCNISEALTGLYAYTYVTDLTNTIAGVTDAESPISEENCKMFCIQDASVNTCLLENTKAYGISYFTGGQADILTTSAVHSKHLAMFNSNSASKTVIGSSILSKRISKLSSLGQTDILTVSPTGWYINDTTNIDSFIASQQILTAGGTADIDAIAEVVPLCFDVVVPTTLPIYISAEGEVSTASNASVVNKSNAAVKITSVNIEAKPESGWTLVASNPSDVRDANEFSFTTSLEVDTVILRDAEHAFTYEARLSPMTAGTDSLNLATVSVTVDWAD